MGTLERPAVSRLRYARRMGEPLQSLPRGRSRSWMAIPLAAVGLALLLGSAAGMLRLTLTARESGFTRGGSAELVERCSRSMPADLAKSCIEDSQRRDAAAWWQFGLGAGGAVVLLGLALRQGQAGRRARPTGRSAH